MKLQFPSFNLEESCEIKNPVGQPMGEYKLRAHSYAWDEYCQAVLYRQVDDDGSGHKRGGIEFVMVLEKSPDMPEDHVPSWNVLPRSVWSKGKAVKIHERAWVRKNVDNEADQ